MTKERLERIFKAKEMLELAHEQEEEQFDNMSEFLKLNLAV